MAVEFLDQVRPLKRPESFPKVIESSTLLEPLEKATWFIPLLELGGLLKRDFKERRKVVPASDEATYDRKSGSTAECRDARFSCRRWRARIGGGGLPTAEEEGKWEVVLHLVGLEDRVLTCCPGRHIL